MSLPGNSKIHFGILSTGNIAKKFAQALLSDSCKDKCSLVAVASRGGKKQNAENMIKELLQQETASKNDTQNVKQQDPSNVDASPSSLSSLSHEIKAYGSYDELVQDSNVDVVYIGSPHVCHKENAILCLSAGKHVICEKPFTLNSQEAQEVINLARKKQLFCMEAMWTRFFPAIQKVKHLLESDAIGDILSLNADFGFFGPYDSLDHRLYNADLGGGSLLDVGIYPLALAWYIFNRERPISVKSEMAFHPKTGVDETTSIIMRYERQKKPPAIATLQCSIRTKMSIQAIISGTKGYIKIHAPFYKPHKITLCRAIKKSNGWFDEHLEEMDFSYGGNGFQFEILHLVECLKSNKTESEIIPLDETLELMEMLDFIRQQNGFTYPSESSISAVVTSP